MIYTVYFCKIFLYFTTLIQIHNLFLLKINVILFKFVLIHIYNNLFLKTKKNQKFYKINMIFM